MSETSAAVPRVERVPARPRRNWWRVLWKVMQVAPWVAGVCLLLTLVATLTWLAVETYKTMTPHDVKAALWIFGTVSVAPVLGVILNAASRFVLYVRRRAEEE